MKARISFIGPAIAIFSFVCSIGNVPLAAVLNSSGISFGGVISLLFADLIIVPILLIYRKYYGTQMTLLLLAGFYRTMVIGGYFVEILFGGLGLQPDPSRAEIADKGITLNYTTVLNVIFFILSAVRVTRFLRTGRRHMLSMMRGDSETP